MSWFRQTSLALRCLLWSSNCLLSLHIVIYTINYKHGSRGPSHNNPERRAAGSRDVIRCHGNRRMLPHSCHGDKRMLPHGWHVNCCHDHSGKFQHSAHFLSSSLLGSFFPLSLVTRFLSTRFLGFSLLGSLVPSRGSQPLAQGWRAGGRSQTEQTWLRFRGKTCSGTRPWRTRRFILKPASVFSRDEL